MTSAKTSCSVCAEPLEAHTTATCDVCGKAYHLNHRTDLPGKDCGQVWINEEHLGLEFACDSCLHPPEAGGALDDVLDLGEAAMVAQTSEDAMAQAAAAGAVRHRRTSGGTYLFERGDVIDFARGRR